MPLINCPECNGQTSTHAHNCPHCGFPSPGNSQEAIKDLAEESEIEKEYVQDAPLNSSPPEQIAEMEEASFSVRATAMGIDLAICIAIYSAVMQMNLSNKLEERLTILALTYLLFRDSFGGRSIGKRIAGLVLISEKNNSPLKPHIALLRNLFIMSPVIVPLLIFAIFPNLGDGWSKGVQKLLVNVGTMAILAGMISAFMGRDAAFHLVGFKIKRTS